MIDIWELGNLNLKWIGNREKKIKIEKENWKKKRKEKSLCGPIFPKHRPISPRIDPTDPAARPRWRAGPAGQSLRALVRQLTGGLSISRFTRPCSPPCGTQLPASPGHASFWSHWLVGSSCWELRPSRAVFRLRCDAVANQCRTKSGGSSTKSLRFSVDCISLWLYNHAPSGHTSGIPWAPLSWGWRKTAGPRANP
jgi:hypothetical protein